MTIPPVDAALLPREVREAGPRERSLYAAALGFERMLTRELARAVTAAGEEAEGGAGDGMRREMLPDALADGIQAAGGLGLAPLLYRGMRGDA